LNAWRRQGVSRVADALKGVEDRNMTLTRMDNVLIVVDDLEATKAFFIELGLTLEAGSCLTAEP
jgi:hypothetical protein